MASNNDLEGITLYDYTNPGVNVVITAEQGAISFSPDFRKLIMDLHAGEIHTLDLQDMNQYRRIREGVWKAMWLADVVGVARRGRKKHN